VEAGAGTVLIGVPNAKTTLFERLRNDAKRYRPTDTFAFPGPVAEYFHQLTAERFGARTGKWIDTQERNEALIH
jgi:phage terminase large subunit GpA-like protein